MKPAPRAGRVRITSADGWASAAVQILEAALACDPEPGDTSLRVALSGGSTPEPVYRALAEGGRVDWTRIEILPADERFVAEDHPDSNHRMIRAALEASAIGERRMPFFGRRKGRSLAEAAQALAGALPPHLDLLLLGIGMDGHTASLFPGSPQLLEFRLLDAEAPGPGTLPSTLAIRGAPKPPAERITISPVVIASARQVVVLARGPEKADAVGRALGGVWDPVGTPAQWARTGTWVLDPGAAVGL